MATSEDTPFSLRSLEDELTCSICLSPFDCPVTIPCGHNFCQSCLLATWKEAYSCPQCRTHFSAKPELKKNTVLSTVVETFNLRSNKSDVCPFGENQEAQLKDVIRCDICIEVEASQTCLTCMASFCEEHLRPHRENPNFAVHQLSEPVRDLLQRICMDHHKLMELFCKQHVRPICSLCLQLDHKGCPFTSPEEQRTLKECELRDKMSLLEGKIEKSETVMFQMNDAQSKLKAAAAKRKATLAAVYEQVRDILAQEERKAQNEVDHELEIGQTKLRDLEMKLTDNSAKMRKAKEDINCRLSSSQTLAFLKTSFNLPKVTKFEPDMPQINLDSKKVTATLAFAGALKVHLTEILEQPVETRLPITKPGEKSAPVSTPASTGNTRSKSTGPPRSRRPASPPIQPLFQPFPVSYFNNMGPHSGWHISNQYAHGMSPGYNRGLSAFTGQETSKYYKKSAIVHTETNCYICYDHMTHKDGVADSPTSSKPVTIL
uniref:Tripartite motif containing 25 n=1 Tax=Scophthalmus maximus TaxID=52904 RepID=A0A8D3D4F4_SCOMX